jgi:hypothetical protein
MGGLSELVYGTIIPKKRKKGMGEQEKDFLPSLSLAYKGRE